MANNRSEEILFRTKLFRDILINYGFDEIGISKAQKLDSEEKKLAAWLHDGNHGTMSYMENHFDKRLDPTKLVHGAKSVISISYNYYTEVKQQDKDAPKISSYAYGRDYHKVIKKKLIRAIKEIQETIGDFNARCFVDSAPIMERQWAERSGLGWLGKNTLLINKYKGSYFFLAEIVTDLEFEYDSKGLDHCGTCTKCIDACPTEAIDDSGYILDANKCISYLTIERKESLPDEFKPMMDNWMFGCDICQQVCPWNRFSSPHQEKDFDPNPNMIEMTKKEWEEITEEIFDELFNGTPVKRTKYSGLKRNIEFLKS